MNVNPEMLKVYEGFLDATRRTAEELRHGLSRPQTVIKLAVILDQWAQASQRNNHGLSLVAADAILRWVEAEEKHNL